MNPDVVVFNHLGKKLLISLKRFPAVHALFRYSRNSS